MEERRALSDEARQPVCVGGVRAAGVEPAARLRAAAARPEYCGAVSRLGGARERCACVWAGGCADAVRALLTGR